MTVSLRLERHGLPGAWPGLSRTAQLPGRAGGAPPPTGCRGRADGGLVSREHGAACLEAPPDSSAETRSRHSTCPGTAPATRASTGSAVLLPLPEPSRSSCRWDWDTGARDLRESGGPSTGPPPCYAPRGVSTSAPPPRPGGRFTGTLLLMVLGPGPGPEPEPPFGV